MIEFWKQEWKDKGRHISHDDFTKFFTNVQRRANFLTHLVDNFSKGNNLSFNFTIGRLVDHLDDCVDIADAVLVGDDVKGHWNCAINENPLQSFDVSGRETLIKTSRGI